MSLRHALWTLFSPSQLIVAALLIGLLLLAVGWRRSGRWLAALGAIGMIAAGLLPTGAWLALPLESRFPVPALPDRIDGVIQLAGAERVVASAATGTPQLRESAGRYFATVQLALRYPDARIVHSGNGADRPRQGVVGGETAIARRVYADLGLAPSRITFESRSPDTCMSARNTRDLLGADPADRWVLVTSAMHLPRAVACFRAAGWNVIPYPADRQAVPAGFDIGSWRIVDNLRLFDLASHEWLGLVYYRLSGRTGVLLPAPIV